MLGEGFVSDLLAGPMQHFCKQYPGIKVNLDLGGTNDVMRKISEDEGEIGLVYNPPKRTEDRIARDQAPADDGDRRAELSRGTARRSR